ncbi:MAG: TonB-dependent receptor, partial [Calditrichaeota bacterium]
MKGSFILLLLMCTSVLFAVSTSQLTGTVIDAETGQPLPGANVFIVGTFLGSGSDQNGAYSINRLDAGSYVLKAAYMGYSSSSVQINLAVGESATVNFNLKSTSLPGEQIVVTGSRQPENLASAAGSINVLGKEEMARRANFRIDEALSSLPGVALVGENINIRGGSGYNRLGGSRALVLLDDVPMLTSDLGEANWSLVPITEVEHIEVSKGAASSLYGSGALSGVVNIKTKQASFSPSLSFRQTSGFYDKPSVPGWQWTDSLRHFDKTDLSYSQSFGNTGLRLAVTRHVSTGDRQNGQFQRWYVTAKVNTQLPGNSTLTLFSTYSRENRGLFLQ